MVGALQTREKTVFADGRFFDNAFYLAAMAAS